ncbi:hypothetical protein CsSME_00038914 [Camellia sinensis var. sinensis]
MTRTSVHTSLPYDILSDEEKRKNYDLYGVEKGNPGFDAGNAGHQGGYTYFTSGPRQNGFNFRPNEWQNMGGGHGSSKSFSFSFRGPGGHSSSGFGLDDIFSNFFGVVGVSLKHLPRFSKRVDLNHFEFSSGTGEILPKVLLLTTKKDTPVIWRVLSGLYHKRFVFYDVEVFHACGLEQQKVGS